MYKNVGLATLKCALRQYQDDTLSSISFYVTRFLTSITRFLQLRVTCQGRIYPKLDF